MLDRFRRNTSKKSTASMESKEEEKTKGSSASSPRTSRDVDHAWQLEDEKDEEVRQVRASSPGLAASPQSAGTSSKECSDLLGVKGGWWRHPIRAMWRLVLTSALATADVALRGGGLPSCTGKPNFQLAQTAWCGQQVEPVACYKEHTNANPIWDCHLSADGWCTIGGIACAWPGDTGKPVLPPLPPPRPPVVPGEATRFVTWNLYVFTLAGRINPVVDELMRMQPEIAAIPEMWSEKDAILARLNQVSGNVYAFATGGATEQFNDADILFRSDKWEHIDSNLVPFSAGRAVNWAVLRRKADGYTLIAAGTHPLCCRGDYVIMEAVDFVTRTLSEVQKRHPYPIVLMGDLNTGYYQPSQKLLRTGAVEAYGRHWEVPMTFVDAWAQLHPEDPDPSTINDDPVRLDYVYFQKTPLTELPDVLIPSGASLLEGLRLLLVHHLRSSAGSDQINLTAGQAELLEHHLERLSSYAQKIVHTLAFATRFLPQDRSEGDREAHEVEVRSEVSRGGASDPRPRHDVDVKVAAAPKRSTLRLKDRELLQIYRGAQMEACLEADWRGLVTPRTTARSDMSLYSDSSTRPESLTGDDRARVLRTLSEAMRAPGRTPSVLAAEIVETSQDTGCGCQSQKARAARKVAAAAGIGWPQPPPDPGQRRPD
ncbi:Putative fucosyltransferase [Durusdinium trenchii]|uniref:Fucosyltransferase n=1 Tax=Durusdinium trenchii TaxID=1381693 RepID=A0ABP0RZP8_9DINO